MIPTCCHPGCDRPAAHAIDATAGPHPAGDTYACGDHLDAMIPAEGADVYHVGRGGRRLGRHPHLRVLSPAEGAELERILAAPPPVPLAPLRIPDGDPSLIR